MLVRILTKFSVVYCSETLWDLGTIKVSSLPADDGQAMPSLYFCQPHAQNQGMLRAILSLDDCKHLAPPERITYLGEQFPKVDTPGQTADFAVLGITPEEADAHWRPGYYRVEADLMELNAQLLTLAR